MKKKLRSMWLLSACALCLVASLLIGCESNKPDQATDTPTLEATEVDATPGVDTDTERPTTPATVQDDPTESPTEAPTEAPTEPMTEEETRQTMDIFGNSYNTNMLVGFDEQGHSFDAVSAPREDKNVGMFYFLWLGQHGAKNIYDVDKIRREYGDEVTFHQDVPESPAGQFHWWSEPLFGYYSMSDEWVIRKHMELLTDAGVDFIVFDTTNASTYDQAAMRVMKVISELRAEGWNCPQVVYYTHSYSIRTAQHIYDLIYKKNVYPDAWYRVDGKPMIIAYTKGETDTKVSENNSYQPGDMSQEMQDFFYIRQPRWPYDPKVNMGWPYTEWTYPQPLNTDMISVSIATHPGVPFSFSLTHENWMNWGRGYNVKTKENVHDDIMKGTFYDAEWDIALRRDPKFVFVTGWNEWVSIKSPYGGEYMYCDNVDMEYSRDAEPMRGGYEDAYFIQTIQRIREYKYEPINSLLANVIRKRIDITGELSQWNDVNAVYRRVGKDSGERNAYGGATAIRYQNDPVRNNILEVRVTNDEANLYFLITCEKDVVTADGTDWMNLFIGRGRPTEDKGWERYEFAVNRLREGNKAVVETLHADYTGEHIGDCDYAVNGRYVQISIPRALLGLEGTNDFYFKVADGVQDPAEITSYYASGRSLPMGRMSYLYQFDK